MNTTTTASRQKHVRVRAYAIAERVPPTEIQLWNAGENPTDYGTHYFTEQSAASIMARYTERGNPLLIDVEHNGALLDDATPAQTAGYAALEIRDGAPWLTFEWSAYGVEQIASGQRRFLSPEYDVDVDSNEITRLYRVSLVADPGTYRARVLASASFTTATEGTHMDPTLAAIMSLLDSVTDPQAAIDAVRGFVANLPASDGAPVDDVVAPMAADAPKPADKPAFASADDDDKKPVAAAAPVAAVAPVAASAPVGEDASVKAARAYALQSENALRDTILLRDGHRLAPSVRTWASTQSLGVVRGLCAAAPEAPASTTRVAATRGQTHGTGTVGKGLSGPELELVERAAGTFQASASNRPHRDANGNFVYPTVTPTEHRRMKAAAAAKDGK